jgi:hypothetical protein
VAKKPRTPDPPRRVQAPQRRHAPRTGLSPERRRALLLYGGAAGGLIALAVVLVIVLGNRGESEAANPAAIAATMRAAGCQYKDVPAAPGTHITTATQTVTYDTYPPTSGMHHPAPAIWGNYSQPVDPRQAVHDLEHGGIVIWYGPRISDAQRTAITDFYNDSPNGILVTPIEANAKYVKYPPHKPLTTEIALSAWTAGTKDDEVVNARAVLAVCPRFDDKAFTTFRDTFRGKGPERFSVDSLKPGT